MRQVLTIAIATLLANMVLAAEPAAYDLGDKLELFVDRDNVETISGDASLRLHPPRDAGEALKFDSPWDGKYSAYVTVFRDGEKFRMYYRGWPAGPQDDKQQENLDQTACYAESADGITWTKPNLGLFEINGSKDNNVVWHSGEHPAHNFTPFLDANPAAPADERYKAVCGIKLKYGPGLFGFVSPDGIHWRRVQDTPILTDGAFDSQNIVFWDTVREKYVAYFRIFSNGSSVKHRIRGIATATSDDFLHWSPTEPIAIAEPTEEEFYTNAITPYFREPHEYFAFPKRYVRARKLLADWPTEGISDGVFLSSRDGVHFERTFAEALLRPGRSERNWGDRSNMFGWGLVQTGPDEMSIYYSSDYKWPTASVHRGVWRLDGIASLHAGGEPGELVTKPLTFSGGKLVLNFATSAAGSVRVEIQDAEGRPLDGFSLADAPELYGDEIAKTCVWTGGDDVSKLSGQTVRLRFVLTDADLYSYRFEK